MNIKKLKEDKTEELSLKQREKEKVKTESNSKVKDVKFWYDDGKGAKINHLKLMQFYSANGFYKLKLGNSLIVIRDDNNRIEEVDDDDLIEFTKTYLNKKEEAEILEVFTKGISSYLGPRKMSFLDPTIKIIDRDSIASSRIFFKNCYVLVTENGLEIKEYKCLNAKIWKTRILDREFIIPTADTKGQFESFCFNISKKDFDRLLSLQAIIGYLLHRNKEKGEIVAIILYDELMNSNGETNGRTGKTLISDAIKELREIITFDGKNIKKNSWYKFQRLNITTDIINFDDLNQSTSLQDFYSILTTGVEIEKKRKDAIQLNFLESPKVLLSSNHIVRGPGGSSDRARRHEFELANHYNDLFTPEVEFKNRFFGNHWSTEEWNKFYKFMMDCISCYLKNGLIKAKPINFKEATIIDKTSNEFYEWIKVNLVINKNIDKRAFKESFISENKKFSNVSEHRFAKWLMSYCNYIGGEYSTNSSGGDYTFKISKS